MTDKVFMSPNNGQLVVGTPLYRLDGMEQITSMPFYSIGCFVNKPMAYVLHADKCFIPQVFSAEWIEDKMICLGDL